ncbi:MAG: hypothetical protein K1X39_09160 [Thermoflexales bacterium]|nr:hypothetical protein [Thermoflexales bacterium]
MTAAPLQHPVEKPPASRPAPLPGRKPGAAPAPPVARTAQAGPKAEEKPLLVGDLSFAAIGFAGLLTVLLMLAAAYLVGRLSAAEAHLTWFVTRGAGIAAYLLMTAVMVYGLLLSARAAGSEMPAPIAYAMHEYLSWLALAFTAAHLGVLLFDAYLPFTLPMLLTPFASAYEPEAVALGQAGFYISLIVAVSVVFRKRARRLWRALHYASLVGFILATAHGLLSGTDSAHPATQAMYVACGGAVLAMTAYRIAARTPKF